MNVKSTRPTQAEIEAGQWVAALSERLVSVDQRHAFETWLEADPVHARAYEAGKGALQVAGVCADLLEEARAEEAAESTSRRKRLAYLGLAASLLIVLGTAFWGARPFFRFGLPHRFETATAQVKDIQLNDGTLVTLGAASQIAVDFSQHERQVRLTRGEAFFEVARDTRRPFLVIAGDTVVRVLGTKFDVHYSPQAVRVAVAEGRVEVMHTGTHPLATSAPAAAQRRLLTARDMAVATTAGAIVTSSHSNLEDLGAWRQGRLVYVDARLKDIVSDMNRYFDGEIRLANAALGERQLTITFNADEIDQAISLIEGALSVHAVRSGAKRVVLAQR